MDESSSTLKKFFSRRPILLFKRGEALIREGDPTTRVYWIKKGFVRLYLISETGDEISLHIYQPDCFIPTTLGLSDTFMPYTFAAMTPVEAQCTSMDEFMEYLEKNPSLYRCVIKRNAKMMKSFFQRMEVVLTKSAYEGVAFVLSRFTKTFGCGVSNSNEPVKIPLSHQEIATWLSTTRETVSRQIERLKAEGMIATSNRHITILTPRKLSEIYL